MIEGLLKEALSQGITPGLALNILEESAKPEEALKLFGAASRIRDEHLGQELWWSAGISGIFPCTLTPRCSYCTFYAESFLPSQEIAAAAKELANLGIRHMHLSGGTCLQGYDQELIALVQEIRCVSDIDVEVNLGPSLSVNTIKILKDMGIKSVTSSLEVCNDELFRQVKPGDSLEARKDLIEMCEQEEMSVRSMILIGIGESLQDRIEHLFYLQKFHRLYHLRFSRFYPYPQTACSEIPRCSPWDLARTIAVARLILPHVQLGLAAGNNHDDIPLWFLAGGGNQVSGASVSRKLPHAAWGQNVIRLSDNLYLIDRRRLIEHYMEGMGRRIV
ncbi:MAG: radical SAM protein [Desulfosporosinus sp.]